MECSDARQSLRDLLAGQRLAVLATCESGPPHATLIAFAFTEDLGTLVFATTRATRKFRSIQANPEVALLIDNRTNEVADFRDALAATAHGTAREIDKADSELLQLYLDAHPYLADFVGAPSCALLAVEVERYDLVGSFQNVLEIDVR